MISFLSRKDRKEKSQRLQRMNENDLSFKIIGIALDIHKVLGPGLLESVYETALAHDLNESGLKVKVQHALPVYYKDVKMDTGFRIDVLVEDKVLIEVKSVEVLAPVHFAQTLTYLKLSNLKFLSSTNKCNTIG